MLAVVPLLGQAALDDDGKETALHRRLPATGAWGLLLRALAARRYRDLLRSGRSVRNLRFTGEALLGLLLSSQSMPLDAFQVTLGRLDGPVKPRVSFPVPRPIRRLPGVRTAVASLFGAVSGSVPTDPDTVYGWVSGGAVEIQDFGRQVAGGPLGYVDAYFGARMWLDAGLGFLGVRSVEFRRLKHSAAAAAKPSLHVLGGEDKLVSLWLEMLRRLPAQRAVAPGYTHIDVIAAADRAGEPVSTAVAKFLRAPNPRTVPSRSRARRSSTRVGPRRHRHRTNCHGVTVCANALGVRETAWGVPGPAVHARGGPWRTRSGSSDARDRRTVSAVNLGALSPSQLPP
ncbi:MAG: hypothetical protein ACRD0G_12255 [Acidimicrobiales bacterium]